MKNRKVGVTFKINRFFVLSMLFIAIAMSSRVNAKENSMKTYKISSSGKPYQSKYMKSNTYNENTRQYYLLRSYLEQLEKDGGGKLILEKGTYVITNTLYLPSNITIVLSDGVSLNKGSETGTKMLVPSKSLFQMVAPSKASTANISTKYDGESSIAIIGKGNAVIDLKYMEGAVAVVIGHNSNVTIEGITFQKMYGGSFIKIGASKDVMIKNNKFRYHKDSKDNSKEAISLEVPDSVTKGFPYPWSKNDKTVNKNITIDDNEFTKLERAIGSTKYSDNKYQSAISIINNTISETDSHAIRVLNWNAPLIEKNTFSGISNSSGSLKAILISGVKYPTVTNNVFSDSDRAVQIMPWRNNNYGSDYGITYNLVNEQSKGDMLKNTLINMKEYYIRYNKTYNEFTKATEKWVFVDATVTDYTITKLSETFENYFTNYSTYNSNTKQYYVIRSYLEQLERIGGGTLTLKAGTYEITNTLYIPSHVTIYCEDGVVIKKGKDTNSAIMENAKSIFQLAAPSKSTTAGAYGSYDGETDIHFKGQGTVIIDLNYIQDSIGIVLGHNTEVSITGITFQNMYSGHFIELDASRDVIIKNNRFINHKPSQSGIKEAINIDTPDKNTQGFNAIWTNFDCTPNKDILIQNNYFDNLERAIGTHKYSEGKYHENVQVLNNIILNTDSDAIRIINWVNPIIKNNEIKMVAGGIGNDRAILASGVKNPTIMDNTFTDVARAIQLMPWKNSGAGSEYAITYNEISSENITNMLKNHLVHVTENFLRINKTLNVFDTDTQKYYYSYENIKW